MPRLPAANILWTNNLNENSSVLPVILKLLFLTCAVFGRYIVERDIFRCQNHLRARQLLDTETDASFVFQGLVSPSTEYTISSDSFRSGFFAALALSFPMLIICIHLAKDSPHRRRLRSSPDESFVYTYRYDLTFFGP
ncbi:hypothetical protein IW262DRAFT_811841 [Armillaria fumosa]|nr:hypothetical protein IW262DRAFT_811841 [Armillaria fumosa]